MSQLPFENAYQFDSAREALDQSVEDYLGKSGWKHTSDTPGHYWMWLREIDGVTYMVERATAERIQRWIEARAKHPDGPPSSRRPAAED